MNHGFIFPIIAKKGSGFNIQSEETFEKTLKIFYGSKGSALAYPERLCYTVINRKLTMLVMGGVL